MRAHASELIVGRLPRRVVRLVRKWTRSHRFEDGLAPEIDFIDLVERGGLYGRPLRDPEFFRRVGVCAGGFGISWPNEADIAPETLYEWTEEAGGIGA